MDQKKVIVICFITLAALALFILVDFENKSSGEVISQNILYITQPVYFFTGVVEKIEGNTLTVSQKINPMLANGANATPQTITTGIPSPLPTPKIVSITYQVRVSNTTQISQPPAYINYLFKTTTPAETQTKLTIKDIKVGQYITANSQSDLRTLAGTIFEATMINVPQKANALNGKIVSMGDNTFMVKAFPPVPMNPYLYMNVAAMQVAPTMPKEREYTIRVTSLTEISRYKYNAIDFTGGAPSAPQTEKLAFSDLKKDMQITIFIDGDATQGDVFTALRIEPQIIIPLPGPVSVVPSVSPVNTTITPTP